ncbi:MAG: P1 family peptidase [Gemmatimonadota bacterium]
MGNRTLTAVPGLRVGHAGDARAATGCTAILGPFAAAVEIRGMATGSRELDALSLLHLVPVCDAIVLTGGSAFGLAAADGVAAWLEERGYGFPTPAARVPIVPAAVIYDLGVGRADIRPDAAMGRAAAEAASTQPVGEGRVGAGTGATVGKLRGIAASEPGGIGSWADRVGDHAIGALAVVNAFGDVLDGQGRILAGCRDPEAGFVDTAEALRRGADLPPAEASGLGQNTTLCVVATDLGLGKRELKIVARQAFAALARRISPSGTPLDGDVVFAISTGAATRMPSPRPDRTEDAAPLDLLRLGVRASAILERALERAVGGDAGGSGEAGAGTGGARS